MARTFCMQFDVGADAEGSTDINIDSILSEMTLNEARRQAESETLELVGEATLSTIPHEHVCFTTSPECPWIHYLVRLELEDAAGVER